MGTSVHRFRAFEARRINHPVLGNVEKYWLTVAAKDFPPDISTSANARDPVGLNRRVYRDVKDSLLGKTSVPGSFDLMNKGITILAQQVRLVDKEKNLFDIYVDDETGGIVDGAHTARILQEAKEDNIPDEQFVEVFVRTGIDGNLRTDIARGLNTGMQVAPHSILNIDGVFDWLKDELRNEPYFGLISWKESDKGEYDVRDLIAVLECLNIFDYPNDSDKHPIAAYEKWSVPLQKFGEESAKGNSSKYYRLRRILRDALTLHDMIRRDFQDVHNRSGGSAGNLKLLEKAGPKRGTFDFPFADIEPHEYRLTKGALYPILAAFRNVVTVDQNGDATWSGSGFSDVKKVWRSLGANLVAEVVSATREIGRLPDQIGKSRKVWSGLHRELGFRLLQREMAKSKRG